jgi:ATP-dependent helicase HrpA
MSFKKLNHLSKKIPQTMCYERHSFILKLHNLRQKLDQHKLDDLTQKIEKSIEIQQKRIENLPKINFADDLPINQHIDEIAELIENNQVVIIAGETGCGKTTQIPKICLKIGRGTTGFIGCTQPRRIAARSISARIATELETNIGHAVGYKIRFSDKFNENTYIKLMTDGILLAETQGDRFLDAYDTIIIDEAHERSLNIDFLLGYLKKLLPKRPDLKVIITSATIDTQRFSKHFNNAPVIEVSGRTYPVEVRYHERDDDDDVISEVLF